MYDFSYQGRRCNISRETRTNNAGGRRGRAWYTVYIVIFEDGAVEGIKAAEFNSQAICLDCGHKRSSVKCQRAHEVVYSGIDSLYQ